MSQKKQAATRRFAYSVVEVVSSKRTPQQKLGAICRLARNLRGLAGTAVAQRIGRGASHVYSLEVGEFEDLNSYRPVIDLLCLDHETLIRMVTTSQNIDMVQAQALLLNDEALAANPEVDEKAPSPAIEAAMQSAFAQQVFSALAMDWSPARKLGEICRLLRHRHQWTQQAVGDRVGRSCMYISEIEKGKLPLDRYPPIIRALGVDDRKLFEIVQTNEPKRDEIMAVLLL